MDSYLELRKFLIIGIVGAICFYVAGPVGLGVLALFFLLKGSH